MAPSLKSKVLVAMSGGVDSCVAAALLVEQGYDVVGVTMRVVAHEEHQSVFQPCCSALMAEDARQVADLMGFPHYSVNLIDNFERHVIEDFTQEYLRGRTPNPCIRCNQRLKYGTLYKKAIELDADYIATGHYIRLARMGHRYSVQRAVYKPKDQSYVMGGLAQRQLAKALFPLGEMTKEETRAKARELGLRAADTPESQDICFIPDNDYKGYIQRRTGAMEPGPIVTTSGEVIGQHQGLMRHTVGQRRGLGIGGSRPLFVIRLDPPNNTLIVGHEEETYCSSFQANELIWGGLAPRSESFECSVQIRYHHEPVPCTAVAKGKSLHIELHEPERAVTPGQWAVLYDDEERVLAAANIETFESANVASCALSESG